MAKITGRVIVTVGGNVLLNKEGAKITGVGISGADPYELEPVMGDTGIHGYKEMPIAPTLECTITDRSDISLSELAKIGSENLDAIVTFQVPGGKASTIG